MYLAREEGKDVIEEKLIKSYLELTTLTVAPESIINEVGESL
jgi:hypothetical protein